MRYIKCLENILENIARHIIRVSEIVFQNTIPFGLRIIPPSYNHRSYRFQSGIAV